MRHTARLALFACLLRLAVLPVGAQAPGADSAWAVPAPRLARAAVAKPDSALAQILALLPSLEAKGDSLASASAHYNAGYLRVLQGDFTSARAHLLRAQALATPPVLAARVRALRAFVHEKTGQFDSARIAYQAAAAQFEALGEAAEAANAIGGLGNVAYAQEDLPLAQRHYEDGIARLEVLGSAHLLAKSYNDLGLVISAQGNSSLAIGYFLKAIQAARASGNDMGRMYSHYCIGATYDERNEPAKAEEHLRQAIALADSQGRVYEGIVARAYLAGMWQEDRPAEAIDLLTPCVATARQGQYALVLADSYKILATAHRKLRHRREAARYAALAREAEAQAPPPATAARRTGG